LSPGLLHEDGGLEAFLASNGSWAAQLRLLSGPARGERHPALRARVRRRAQRGPLLLRVGLRGLLLPDARRLSGRVDRGRASGEPMDGAAALSFGVPKDRVPPGSQTSLREANRARIIDAVQKR